MKRLAFGLLFLSYFLVSWAVAESDKAPELPQDLKYKYMMHAFQRADVQRQFIESLTPQQRLMSNKIIELNTLIYGDEQALKPLCGSTVYGYTPDGEPFCSAKQPDKASEVNK